MPDQNPVRAEPNWPAAIVGGTFQTGLNLMRDLLRKGVRTVAVDNDLNHEGFRSVYGKTYECPNPDTHPAEWVAYIKELGAKLGGKPVFIPSSDIFVAALGRHARELAPFLSISPEGAELQAAVCTKDVQYKMAAEYGLPCPRLAYVQSRKEVEKFVTEARFPCLLKPLSMREWDMLPENHELRGKKIIIVDTASELLRYYDSVEPFRKEAIAQEVIPGMGSAKRNHISVWGEGGRLIGYCLMRHVRDYPIFTGTPSVVMPLVDDELAAIAGAFLSKIKFRGICEFEMKRDSRNNELRLIEINPRFSATGDAASYAGLDIGWLHYLDMIGHPVQPVTPAVPNFHYICAKIEAAETPPYLLGGKITWAQFFAPYRTKRAFFDFDWRDWTLAVSTMQACLRSTAGAVLRYWKGKRV